MKLKATLQDCHAYRFSVQLQNVGMAQLAKEEYMRDKISGFVGKASTGPDFFFFNDWSLLVIDEEEHSFRILEKETICRMLVDLFPFDQENMTQVKDFELETSH